MKVMDVEDEVPGNAEEEHQQEAGREVFSCRVASHLASQGVKEAQQGPGVDGL